jgi:hypothetical protein
MSDRKKDILLAVAVAIVTPLASAVAAWAVEELRGLRRTSTPPKDETPVDGE